MIRVSAFRVNGSDEPCVTDDPPRFSFALDSEAPREDLAVAELRVGSWTTTTRDQTAVRYDGPLSPRTDYQADLRVTGSSGDTATASAGFRTGRLGLPWHGRWITDADYRTPDKQSPVPMEFRTTVRPRTEVARAWLEATALGVYDVAIDGMRISDDYFAPGFTSYHHTLQYQSYDVTARLQGGGAHVLSATVAGGWAVGSFTHQRKNRIYADRQAFLAELHVDYVDGTSEVIGTGPDWEVSLDGPYRMAEWYDGETYDATVDDGARVWAQATITAPRRTPTIVAQRGPAVRATRRFTPVARSVAPSGEVIYDFGQNFAGVVHAVLQGSHGQRVTFRHAEVLVDGELFVESLRTAKATATYICRAGAQTYSPRLTYMGFRYVGVTGIDPSDLELTALAVHSDVRQVGTFACSDDRLNRLQSAIEWGARSNLVDIPTDCPQRDEREGWTGDYAVFARTASFTFDMGRFLDKWLRDLSSEQSRGGGIPMVVPRAGNPFPVMATACWGDVCVLAPWAEYLARGDLHALSRAYPTMRRFLKAAAWWAGLFSLRRDARRVWRWPFHFGDWTSPDGSAKEWIAKGRWIATAYLANSYGIVADIADLVGEPGDAARYRRLRDETVDAFRRVFTDGAGTLANEFQTAYVLPLHFGMTAGKETEAMVANLVRLIDEAGGHLRTGFPGTPYILFALSDNGRVDAAYDLLLQTGCPSWLYMLEAGGTTIWERWDALRPDGSVNVSGLRDGESDGGGGMVSFNHYAAGAVGDWLYRRVAGIEPTSGGYRTFRVRPLLGGGLTWASASVDTPYGRAAVDWRIVEEACVLRVEVPVSTRCTVDLPDGRSLECGPGSHEFSSGLPG